MEACWLGFQIVCFVFWEVSIDASVDSCSIVIVLELVELSLEVERVPEKEMIEILATDCSDEALDEGMRNWNVGN